MTISVPISELYASAVQAFKASRLDEVARLATHPEALAALRQTLAERNQPLFMPDRFRRQIEAAYLGMWEIWQRGEEPRAFAVDKFD